MDRVEFHQQCVLGGIACGVVQEDDVAARTGVDQVTQDQFADAAKAVEGDVGSWAFRLGGYVEADGIDAGLEGEAAEAVEREFDESGDPAAQRGVGLGETRAFSASVPVALTGSGRPQ